MRRLTITVDQDLLDEVDRAIASRDYANRSEALRGLARAGLRHSADRASVRPCVAALVYTYDHRRRELPKRLTKGFHEHRDLAVSTLHVHMDERRCLEVTVLKGRTDEVRHFADHVIAERGLRDGQLVIMPAEAGQVG